MYISCQLKVSMFLCVLHTIFSLPLEWILKYTYNLYNVPTCIYMHILFTLFTRDFFLICFFLSFGLYSISNVWNLGLTLSGALSNHSYQILGS